MGSLCTASKGRCDCTWQKPGNGVVDASCAMCSVLEEVCSYHRALFAPTCQVTDRHVVFATLSFPCPKLSRSWMSAIVPSHATRLFVSVRVVYRRHVCSGSILKTMNCS